MLPHPPPASQNAVMDSFQFKFTFDSTTHTVNLVINHSPTVVGTPSMPGPFTVGGAANTFNVASDFTDRNGDTLTYALGTVVGPVPTAVDISDDGTVTIDATATAGEYTIPVTAMESEEDGGLSATRNYVVTVNNLEISVSAVNASVAEGADAEFTVTASAAPASDLTVNVDVSDVGSFISSPAPTTVTIQAGDTSATLGVATDDDGVDEDNGNLTCEVLPGSGYIVGTPEFATVTVNDNDDGPGITVTPTSLTTTEAAGPSRTATFTVVLDTQPTMAVSIGVSSSDTGEGTVSTDTLTFTNTDWSNAKTVTVTGVDDNVDDGNQMYTIELAPATSTDPNYSGVDPDDVSVSNMDDDVAPTSITLTVLPNTLDEGDSATDVTVTATFDGGTTVLTDTTVMLSLGGTADSGTDYSATRADNHDCRGDCYGHGNLCHHAHGGRPGGGQ